MHHRGTELTEVFVGTVPDKSRLLRGLRVSVVK
jgi:hypothetical protein